MRGWGIGGLGWYADYCGLFVLDPRSVVSEFATGRYGDEFGFDLSCVTGCYAAYGS
jgi:hypothetical protein